MFIVIWRCKSNALFLHIQSLFVGILAYLSMNNFVFPYHMSEIISTLILKK